MGLTSGFILILKKSKMKHVAAYAMLVLGGTAVPEPQQVMDLLKEAGVTADKEQVEALCAQFAGKSFNEIVAEGLAKMGSSAPAAGPAAAVAGAAKEASDEEEVDMDCGGLFGGDDEDY